MGMARWAALGGSSLALSQTQTLTNDMTGGRGVVALTAAVLVSEPTTCICRGGAFGGVDAFQLRLQITSPDAHLT